jgi:NMD protein affecting ribosome stability and mRNA decay
MEFCRHCKTRHADKCWIIERDAALATASDDALMAELAAALETINERDVTIVTLQAQVEVLQKNVTLLQRQPVTDVTHGNGVTQDVTPSGNKSRAAYMRQRRAEAKLKAAQH